MKHITLCADDYGQNPAISQAIINLIANKRLSATSCMTNGESWSAEARHLLPYKDHVDIGMHINFTDNKPLSASFRQLYGDQMFSLGKLLVLAYLRQLNKKVIADEINAQLDCFIQAMGCLPHFLDGHQHVHQFPVIRDALIEVYQQRLGATSCYVRSVLARQRFWDFKNKMYIKNVIIQLTGATSLRSLLVKNNIPYNTSFSGVYDFAVKGYAQLFPRFLTEVQEGGLIMCHPGLPMVESMQFDPIYFARVQEYLYFSSEQFLQDCVKNEVKIGRFSV